MLIFRDSIMVDFHGFHLCFSAFPNFLPEAHRYFVNRNKQQKSQQRNCQNNGKRRKLSSAMYSRLQPLVYHLDDFFHFQVLPV